MDNKWYHMTRHVDGTSYRFFATERAALDDMAEFIGRDMSDDGGVLCAGHREIDDYGGVHVVEEAPRGIKTARQMEALGRAYDARECGTATKAQLRLLDRVCY